MTTSRRHVVVVLLCFISVSNGKMLLYFDDRSWMLSYNNSRSTNANCSSTTTSNYAPAGPTSSKIGSVAILNAVATFNTRHTTLHGSQSSNALIDTTPTAVAAFPTIRCNY